MHTSTPNAPTTPAKIAGMPAWLVYSLSTIVLWGIWGVVSKVVSEQIDTNTNQIYFTLGLLPTSLILLRSARSRPTHRRNAGICWAFITGILAGGGNMAFFHALAIGGRASIVIPVTALFPLVTVILAMTFLRERMGMAQKIGLGLAMVAIYLLSLPG